MIVDDISKLAMNSNEAHSVEEAVASQRESILEPKFDGIRLLINVREDGGVRMYSRAGNDKSDRITLIEAEIASVFPPGTWLDAEAVDFNLDGSQNWGGAQSVMSSLPAKAQAAQGNMRLIVFDLIAYGGEDGRGAMFQLRRELLEKIFDSNAEKLNRVMLSPQFEPTQETHDMLVAKGYEGTMIKDLVAPYSSGKRVNGSLKIKLVETVDVVITGYTDGEGKYTNMIGAVIFGQYTEDGTFIEKRGKCSGMTDAFREELTANKDKFIGTTMEISFRTSMPDKNTGLPNYRHPQFERIRWDKEPTECIA